MFKEKKKKKRKDLSTSYYTPIVEIILKPSVFFLLNYENCLEKQKKNLKQFQYTPRVPEAFKKIICIANLFCLCKKFSRDALP